MFFSTYSSVFLLKQLTTISGVEQLEKDFSKCRVSCKISHIVVLILLQITVTLFLQVSVSLYQRNLNSLICFIESVNKLKFSIIKKLNSGSVVNNVTLQLFLSEKEQLKLTSLKMPPFTIDDFQKIIQKHC